MNKNDFDFFFQLRRSIYFHAVEERMEKENLIFSVKRKESRNLLCSTPECILSQTIFHLHAVDEPRQMNAVS